MKNIQVCSRCVYDETVSGISFDDAGVCNYCHTHDYLCRTYPTGAEGEKIVTKLFEQIRREGKGRPYDCVIGVSGGTDSSYLMHKAIEFGLRPLAAHFDNTWNSPISTQNIYNLLAPLGVDLFTYVVDNKEYCDIYRSFMEAGLVDPDVATDIALATTVYMAAAKHGIRYILDGHTFRTEGVAPTGVAYIDGQYIASVHKKHGKLPMKTYPNLTFGRFVDYAAIKGIKRLRPLWWLDYDKAKAREMLIEKYNWVYYGGHHLENIFTAFNHTYIFPKRGVMDTRMLSLAAAVRSGQISHGDGLKALEEPQICPPEVIEMVKTRLEYTDADLDRLMALPRATWRDYKTYKELFEKTRPFWWLMLKLQRVPESFYRKFCFPIRGV